MAKAIYGAYDSKNNEQCVVIGTAEELGIFFDRGKEAIQRAYLDSMQVKKRYDIHRLTEVEPIHKREYRLMKDSEVILTGTVEDISKYTNSHKIRVYEAIRKKWKLRKMYKIEEVLDDTDIN